MVFNETPTLLLSEINTIHARRPFSVLGLPLGVRPGKHVGMVLVGKGRGRRHQSWEDEKEETEEGSYWQVEG